MVIFHSYVGLPEGIHGIIVLYIIWLVVWNMNFIFPYLGNNHPKWLSYFSEGLKPPTSNNGIMMDVDTIMQQTIVWYSLSLNGISHDIDVDSTGISMDT
jgi:hypothetical protein